MSKIPNDGEAMRRLISIDHKTDSMQDSLGWLVRATAKELLGELLVEFGNSERAIKVYLSLDGERSVNELVALLHVAQPDVSRELSWLKTKRLVDVVEVGGGKRYVKKNFDGVVGLSEALEKRLQQLRASKKNAPNAARRSKKQT